MLIGGLAWVFVVGPLEQVTFSIATAAQATVD